MHGGAENGLLGRLLKNFETATEAANVRPLLAFVRKLKLPPGGMSRDVAAKQAQRRVEYGYVHLHAAFRKSLDVEAG